MFEEDDDNNQDEEEDATRNFMDTQFGGGFALLLAPATPQVVLPNEED